MESFHSLSPPGQVKTEINLAQVGSKCNGIREQNTVHTKGRSTFRTNVASLCKAWFRKLSIPTSNVKSEQL